MVDYQIAYASAPIIGIAGPIAAGKTTLCRNLCKSLGWKMVPEPVKTNPYLPLFYQELEERDKEEEELGHKLPSGGHYGFTMQVFLLSKRFDQHQAMIWTKEPAIQDRTIYEDPIFALMLKKSGQISDLDFQTYADLYRSMTNFLHRPDLIIYLDVTPEKAYERLKTRGRECEKGIPLDYLRNLRDGYEDWLKNRSAGIPVLRLDWNNPAETEEVIKLVEAKLGHGLVRLASNNPVTNSSSELLARENE